MLIQSTHRYFPWCRLEPEMSATVFAPSAMHAPARTRPQSPARRPAAVSAGVAQPGWLERLALWADAQPPHHRLGSWTLGR